MRETLILTAVMLIPLVPAYLLYKSLPSKTTVSGPFRGLRIDLTGAFSGYFLLVLIATGIMYRFTLPPSAYPKYYEYEVSGEVLLEYPGRLAPEQRLSVTFSPSVDPIAAPLRRADGHEFSWSTRLLLAERADGTTDWDFDEVHFTIPGFYGDKLKLSEGARDDRARKMRFPTVTLPKIQESAVETIEVSER